MAQLQGRTFVNGSIGALVTKISYLVPILQLFAPVFGGIVAGYLQKQGAVGGMKAGTAKGFIMVLPATVLGTLASAWLADTPVIGELLAGSLVVIVLVIVGHSLALGFVGGLIGGMVAGTPAPSRAPGRRQSKQDPAGQPDETRQATERQSERPSAATTEPQNGPVRQDGPPLGREEQPPDSDDRHRSVVGSPQTQRSTDGEQQRDGRRPRRVDKSGPAAEALASSAARLDTDSEPEAVAEAVEELLDASEELLDAVDRPADYGIHRSDPSARQISMLAKALNEGELELAKAPNREETAPERHRVLQESVDRVRDDGIESNTAVGLLEELETRGGTVEQMTGTLQTTVEQLDAYDRLQASLATLDGQQDPQQLAQSMTTQFEGGVADPGRDTMDNSVRLAAVGRTLERVAADLEECRNRNNALMRAAEDISEMAREQTSWSVRTTETTDAMTDLARDLDDEQLWFADDTTSIAGVAADVETSASVQSKPAEEFLSTLQHINTVERRRLVDTLQTAVDAIDRAETISTRLGGVDADGLTRTADRLLATLETESGEMVPHLRDRIADLKRTAEHSNDVDLPALYAARQEIRFYDRTLVPNLSTDSGYDPDDEPITARLDKIDERRKQMRQSYPSEYPDCDHTIPIYFFDLVSTLLEAARETNRRGDVERAAGLADAANDTLDWIEGLYETHSYFVLLRQLRT